MADIEKLDLSMAGDRCDAATRVLAAEKACVQKNIAGCDRDCGKCALALPDDVIISGFDAAIAAMDQLAAENTARKSEFMHAQSIEVQDALDNAEVIASLKTRAETSEAELEQLQNANDDLSGLYAKYVKIAEKRYEMFERAYARAEKAEAERDAAVEDLKIFSACCQCNANIDGSCCDMFDGTAENKYFCSNWQWRGQQAGEGEKDGRA